MCGPWWFIEHRNARRVQAHGRADAGPALRDSAREGLVPARDVVLPHGRPRAVGEAHDLIVILLAIQGRERQERALRLAARIERPPDHVPPLGPAFRALASPRRPHEDEPSVLAGGDRRIPVHPLRAGLDPDFAVRGGAGRIEGADDDRPGLLRRLARPSGDHAVSPSRRASAASQTRIPGSSLIFLASETSAPSAPTCATQISRVPVTSNATR